MDDLGWSLVAIAAWTLTAAFYADVLIAQYGFDAETGIRRSRVHAMIVNAIRASSIVPLLATSFVVAIEVPSSFGPLMVWNSLVESYSVRCFYCMILTAFGGRATVRAAIAASLETKPMCSLSENAAPVAELVLWVFVYVRPFLEVGVYLFRDVTPQLVGYFTFAVLSYAIAFAALFALLYFVVTLAKEGSVIQLDVKFLHVKLIVFVILAENFVRQCICFSSSESNREFVGTAMCRTATQWYARAVLVQLGLLASFFPWTFKPRMSVAARVAARAKPVSPDDDILSAASADRDGADAAALSPAAFLFDIIAIWARLKFESPGVVGHPAGILGLLGSSLTMPQEAVPLLDDDDDDSHLTKGYSFLGGK